MSKSQPTDQNNTHIEITKEQSLVMDKANPQEVSSQLIDRQIAFLLGALTLGLYLRTLTPGLMKGDAGEFQFAAWHLGLAHPTGYPLYLSLGWLWQHALSLFGISPAWAMNALSAIFGATAVALFYWVMRGWLRPLDTAHPSVVGPHTISRLVSIFSAFLLAVNPTIWSQNLIAEVYTLHLLFLVVVLWSLQRITLTPPHPHTLTPSHPHTPTPPHPHTLTPSHLTLPFTLIGLSLTHHAMTLLFIPAASLYLLFLDRRWWTRIPNLLTALVCMALPLLLYAYIPLRSTPAASPWYHQALGTTTLTLYENNWGGFWAFISGQSISVGFHTMEQAFAQLSQMRLLWWLHFQWTGLVLVGIGVILLMRNRNWSLLALTVSYLILQQTFNLFYAIGDILVYYIPLYLMGVILAGMAAYGLSNWTMYVPSRRKTLDELVDDDTEANDTEKNDTEKNDTEKNDEQTAKGENDMTGDNPPQKLLAVPLGLVIAVLIFSLPISLAQTYLPQLDQSDSTGARSLWTPILDAQPPSGSILISNDRNEIVPLFYLQHVENRIEGVTGMFPLMAPDERFADIGTTVDTALAATLDTRQENPIYLIKPMEGLETKFALYPATPPLIEVRGWAKDTPPMYITTHPLGSLQLIGYDWQENGNTVEVGLHWQMNATLDIDYTATIQVFDAQEQKLGQSDRPVGGVYYPTSLWKAGEVLVDRHTLTLSDGVPTELLIGMYQGGTFEHLADPIRLSLEDDQP
ncbi:MAG: DUF2723 domain-containing protein [Chloroflexota bacterium]